MLYMAMQVKRLIFFGTFSNINLFLKNNFIYLFRILFGKEFGIFWFSPIIFISVIYVWIFILRIKGNLLLKVLLFSFTGFLNFFIWTSTASSYGYRYLYSLIPVSIFIYFQTALVNILLATIT